MRQFQSSHLCPMLLSILFISSALSAPGQTLVVVPNNKATAPGNFANIFPFSTNAISTGLPMRYQQVYAATAFAALSGPMTITQITFRPSADGGMFKFTEPDIQINLATTSRKPDQLDSNFQSNIEANDTVVYPRSMLPLSSMATVLSNGTDAFDITINLTTPFVYDPSKGNLLLDVRNYGGTASTLIDAEETSADAVSRVFSTDVNSPTGNVDTSGLITQFTFQPVGPPVRTASGTVTLQSCLTPVKPDVKFTFEFRPMGSGTALTTMQSLAPTGNGAGTFSISGIQPGKYTLWIKGPYWLATVQTVDLTSQSVSGLMTTLIPGDANNDNSIDIGDFGILVNLYSGDITDPTSGYDPAADFNCDGMIDVGDFGLLVNNYSMTGAK